MQNISTGEERERIERVSRRGKNIKDIPLRGVEPRPPRCFLLKARYASRCTITDPYYTPFAISIVQLLAQCWARLPWGVITFKPLFMTSQSASGPRDSTWLVSFTVISNLWLHCIYRNLTVSSQFNSDSGITSGLP
jgi:hypothetical protein